MTTLFKQYFRIFQFIWNFLFALCGIIFFSWETIHLMLFYWLETVVIIYFVVLYDKSNRKQKQSQWVGVIGMTLFMLFPYGFIRTFNNFQSTYNFKNDFFMWFAEPFGSTIYFLAGLLGIIFLLNIERKKHKLSVSDFFIMFLSRYAILMLYSILAMATDFYQSVSEITLFTFFSITIVLEQYLQWSIKKRVKLK